LATGLSVESDAPPASSSSSLAALLRGDLASLFPDAGFDVGFEVGLGFLNGWPPIDLR
jgi:hypothetical protein